MPYYRTFGSLEDGLHMDGNCQNASTSYPNREAYPCFYDQVTYGMAANSLDTQVPTLPVHIDVDKQQEPDVRQKQKPIELHATVTVRGLTAGQSYALYRYTGYNSFPSQVFDHDYDRKVHFVAADVEWTYKDAEPFLSDGAVYYIAVLDEAETIQV